MATILAFVALITEGFKAIPALLAEIKSLRAEMAQAKIDALTAKISVDTRPLEVGPTTNEEKDAAAKAIAGDIHSL